MTNEFMADAILQALVGKPSTKPETYIDFKRLFSGELSTRAFKVLWREKISDFRDISEARLEGVKNCGPKTINELLAWKKKQEASNA